MSGARPWWHGVESSGLLLRRVVPGDVPAVHAVHSDPRVYELDPSEVHTSLPQTAEFLEPMLDHWAVHGFGYWAVEVPSAWWPRAPEPVSRPGTVERVVVGLGGVQHKTLGTMPVLNVYFRLAPAAHGRGLARQIVERALELAPVVAPDLDVVVRTRPANTAARRVAERAGFVDEGLEPGTTDMQLLRMRAADLRHPRHG